MGVWDAAALLSPEELGVLSIKLASVQHLYPRAFDGLNGVHDKGFQR